MKPGRFNQQTHCVAAVFDSGRIRYVLIRFEGLKKGITVTYLCLVR